MVNSDSVRDAVKLISSQPHLKVGVLSAVGLWLLKNVIVGWWRRKTVARVRQARLEMAENRKNLMRQQCSEAVNSRAIVDKPLDLLIKELKAGQISALEVLHAFQKEALILTEEINCVTEPILAAETDATRLDQNPNKDGLLYGVPISIKENIGLKGCDATGGIASLIGQLCAEDAVIVQVLRHQGAVPFVRTNIPQTMFSYSCVNPIYGCTKNPLDRTRSPGGSSGGEGAIIAGGGAIIGVGTDVGGSVRVPADFCGVYSLKPTKGRLSVSGPMARDLDSLILLSKALMCPKMAELDPSLPCLPFDEKVVNSSSRLRIGFYTYDGAVQCLPSNERAVMAAKAALEMMGHEVVLFDFPKLMGYGFPHIDFFVRMMGADRCKKVKDFLANDKVEPGLGRLLSLTNLPVWFVKCFGSLLCRLDPLLGKSFLGAQGFGSVFAYMTKISELRYWQDDFLKAWQSLQLDAVICPVFPCPAATLDVVQNITILSTYCQLYNSLNYPSGVLPVTKVTKDDIQKMSDPKSFKPNSVMIKYIMKSTQNAEGLSVGVQCVALPFKEELCLRVMKDLEQGLSKKL